MTRHVCSFLVYLQQLYIATIERDTRCVLGLGIVLLFTTCNSSTIRVAHLLIQMCSLYGTRDGLGIVHLIHSVGSAAMHSNAATPQH